MIDTKVFSMAPFYLCHDLLTGMHPEAARTCLTLAAAHLGGLEDKSVFHVGAGCGTELFTSVRFGCGSISGIDINPEQVEMFKLVCEGGAGKIYGILEQDPIASKLYPVTYLSEAAAIASGLPILKPRPTKNLLTYQVADFFSCDLNGVSSGGNVDAVICNVAFHWLVQKRYFVNVVLERMAEFLGPGGIAVVSVPFHFLDLEDRREEEYKRSHCFYRTNIYHGFHDWLCRCLMVNGQKVTDNTRFEKVQGLAMSEVDLLSGSEHMSCVGATNFFYTPIEYSVANVLRGLGLFEAMHLTTLPGTEVVQAVARAATQIYDTSETFGTYVYYFAYRKNE